METLGFVVQKVCAISRISSQSSFVRSQFYDKGGRLGLNRNSLLVEGHVVLLSSEIWYSIDYLSILHGTQPTDIRYEFHDVEPAWPGPCNSQELF